MLTEYIPIVKIWYRNYRCVSRIFLFRTRAAAHGNNFAVILEVGDVRIRCVFPHFTSAGSAHNLTVANEMLREDIVCSVCIFSIGQRSQLCTSNVGYFFYKKVAEHSISMLEG